MKKILYYSPYIPVVGVFTGFLGIPLDYDTCSNSNPDSKHFWLSALSNGLGTCAIIVYLIIKN